MSVFQSFRQWAATSTVAHVGFAFMAMGGWALFANRQHPLGQALVSGVVQGTISALLTLGLKKFLERMSRVFANARTQDEAMGRNMAALFAPIVTAASILAILFTAHTLARTPEIWTTIAFPFTVSTAYAIIYNVSLWRRQHGR